MSPSEVISKIIMVLGFLGIPFGVFITAYLDINDWLVLILPVVAGTVFYLLSQFILKKNIPIFQHICYGLFTTLLFLTLNRYIKVGDAFTVNCKIDDADYERVTGRSSGIRVDDKSYTYKFTNREFEQAWLLRRYNAAMGDMGNHGIMRMTFRRGLFGINVLTATQWIDDDGSVYYERTDE